MEAKVERLRKDLSDAGRRTDASYAYGKRALRDMPGCCVVLGPGGVITYANEAAESVLDIGPFVGRPFAEYFAASASEGNDAFFEMFLEAIRDHEGRFQRRCPFTAPNGQAYTFFVTSSRLSYGEGESYVVVTCADVTAEVEAERMRRESTFVLLSSIVYICLFIFVYSVWNYAGRPGAPSDLTRVLEVGGVILGVFVYKNTSLTFDDLGLSTRNLMRNLKVDALACLGVVAFFALAKVFFMLVAPQVIVHPETFYDPSWLTPGRAIAYVFTALVQEFLTRGIMQESLMRIIVGRHSNLKALLMSTLMFASLHLMYSPIFMLFAAGMLGVLGIIYLRQRSIWGLVLIHFAFGMSGVMFGLI